MSRRITREDIGLLLESGIDVANRALVLNGPVDDIMLTRTLLALHTFSHNRKEEPVLIYLNSEGGDDTAGLGIHDSIVAASFPVTIRVVGSAESMASIILQGADTRQITRNSYLMYHSGEYSIETHRANLRSNVQHQVEQDRRSDQIVVDRMREVDSAYTVAKFRRATVFDRFIWPEEALSLGLVDEVVG